MAFVLIHATLLYLPGCSSLRPTILSDTKSDTFTRISIPTIKVLGNIVAKETAKTKYIENKSSLQNCT